MVDEVGVVVAESRLSLAGTTTDVQIEFLPRSFPDESSGVAGCGLSTVESSIVEQLKAKRKNKMCERESVGGT